MKRPDDEEKRAHKKWAVRFYGLPASKLQWENFEQYDRVWLQGYRAGKRGKARA